MKRPQETEQIFDELAHYWRTDASCADLLQFRRRATAHQYVRLYELVQRFLPPGAAILDWGCGNGHVSYGLTRMGYRVDGYAFEDFGLRRYLGDDYGLELGTPDEPVRLPFEDEQYDGVMSVGVLEHVRETGGNELGSLREVRRVLRPGGHFLCYHFPNRFSLIEALNRRVPAKHSHRFRYERSDIERLCADSGLELVEVRRYGALPRNFWYRIPRAIGDSPAVAAAWDSLDRSLGSVLSPWCQNYLFVARKPRRLQRREGAGPESRAGE